MESRRFVVTPPCLGLDLAGLGRLAHLDLGHGAAVAHCADQDALDVHTEQLLHTAWSQGLAHVCVARAYGRAEAVVSRWSRGLPKEQRPFVMSQWGYTYLGEYQREAVLHEVSDFSLTALRRQWQESRAYLREPIDLYCIQGANPESGVLHDEEVLRELWRLKGQGLRLGLGVAGPRGRETLAIALRLRVNQTTLLFDAVMATWNLLEPSCGDLLSQAARLGLTVIVQEPLANNRLVPIHQALEPAAAAVLATQAARLDTTPTALALAAALHHPSRPLVLSNALTAEEWAEHRTALTVAWDETAATALGALAQSPTAYWQTRQALPWQ